jgi:S-adenosylmethionine-diacylgycerolhomoserine-N-methlytransferase
MTQADILSALNQSKRMEHYYRFHSKIYDATRWTYLFGRDTLIEKIVANRWPTHILEVGCGTGVNLVNLQRRLPQAALVGVDTSAAMLQVARRKLASINAPQVELKHIAYQQPLNLTRPFDVVVFSYALSMFNPGWEQAIAAAWADLTPGGLLAVVDFHDSPWTLFKRWMACNHTRLAGHLLPHLTAYCQAPDVEMRQAYGGGWSYFIFMGQK